MFTNPRICSCQNYNIGVTRKQLIEKRWEGGVIEHALEDSTAVAAKCQA